MDLEVMGKGLWGEKMDLKDQDMDFSPGSQAELSCAELSRQSVQWTLFPSGSEYLVVSLQSFVILPNLKVRNPTKSDLKNVTFILHGWR